MTNYAERKRTIPKIEFTVQYNLHCQQHSEPVVMNLIVKDNDYVSVFECPICKNAIAVTLSTNWNHINY